MDEHQCFLQLFVRDGDLVEISHRLGSTKYAHANDVGDSAPGNRLD